MSETAYWVWLQCALGEGAAVQPLLEEFGSAKAVYDANIMEWRMTPGADKISGAALGEHASVRCGQSAFHLQAAGLAGARL